MSNYCPKCGNKIEQHDKFCTKCGTGIIDQEINNSFKQDQVYKRKPGLSTKNILNIAFFVLLAGSLFIYFESNKTEEEKIIAEQPQITGSAEYPELGYNMLPISSSVSNGVIVLQLDEVLDKKFVRFVYNGANADVPLLAYINEDGTLVTSISMCEPCNSTTFYIKGYELICNSCGTTWDLNNLDAISGSCGKYPPDPIPSTVVGKEIHINEASVINWKRRV